MNKKEKLKQLAFYYSKFFKNVHKMMLEVFTTSTLNTIELGWTSKTSQIPWSITSQPHLTATLNWVGHPKRFKYHGALLHN